MTNAVTRFTFACLVFISARLVGGTDLNVKVLETVKVHESHKYGYFPSVQMLSTGELICDFSLDADTNDVEGNFWAYVISRDKGRTWGMRNTDGFLYREAAYLRDPAAPDGSLPIVAGYPLPTGNDDYRHLTACSVRLSDGGNTALFARDVTIDLEQPVMRQKMDDTIHGSGSLGLGKIKEAALMLFSGTIVRAVKGGGYLTTMYGKFEADKYYRTIVVQSDAAGKAWHYVTTVAGDAEAEAALKREHEEKSEGFCEPRMIRLRDGRLLIVMRRGSNNLMYQSWSDDEGRSWSPAISMGFRGVEPALMEMQNGWLAMCTGRPDPITIRFSTDAGKTWIKPTVIQDTRTTTEKSAPKPRQKTTAYTGLVEVEPNKLMVVYDYLPFVEGWGLNPENQPQAVNTIFATFVTVGR